MKHRPLRLIASRLPLRARECRVLGKAPRQGWTLLRLECGHHVLRQQWPHQGSTRAMCGFCCDQ